MPRYRVIYEVDFALDRATLMELAAFPDHLDHLGADLVACEELRPAMSPPELGVTDRDFKPGVVAGGGEVPLRGLPLIGLWGGVCIITSCWANGHLFLTTPKPGEQQPCARGCGYTRRYNPRTGRLQELVR